MSETVSKASEDDKHKGTSWLRPVVVVVVVEVRVLIGRA